VPVVVGTMTVRPASISVPRLLLAAIVALALQIGTNYANDYSDGIRGTDAERVGPIRLVGQSLASPRSVRAAALASFALGGAAGLVLCALSSWWLLVPGLAAVAAGWLYTGGPRPYGYLGLGELFVFVFFGLFATVGSAFVQHGQLNALAWITAVAVGLLATALLEANNLRDIDGDQLSGKRTLAVRLGRRRAGWLYVGSMLGAAGAVVLAAVWRPTTLLALLGFVTVLAPCRLALSDASGRDLLALLKATGRAQLLIGLLLAIGLVFV
jgi:1,4-dihydroxy-2-naphthoate octaprenyltransferase